MISIKPTYKSYHSVDPELVKCCHISPVQIIKNNSSGSRMIHHVHPVSTTGCLRYIYKCDWYDYKSSMIISQQASDGQAVDTFTVAHARQWQQWLFTRIITYAARTTAPAVRSQTIGMQDHTQLLQRINTHECTIGCAGANLRPLPANTPRTSAFLAHTGETGLTSIQIHPPAGSHNQLRLASLATPC